MSDYIFAGVLLILFGVSFLGAVMAFFADTETFRAIDEKIAKLIRGKDDESSKRFKATNRGRPLFEVVCNMG